MTSTTFTSDRVHWRESNWFVKYVPGAMKTLMLQEAFTESLTLVVFCGLVGLFVITTQNARRMGKNMATELRIPHDRSSEARLIHINVPQVKVYIPHMAPNLTPRQPRSRRAALVRRISTAVLPASRLNDSAGGPTISWLKAQLEKRITTELRIYIVSSDQRLFCEDKGELTDETSIASLFSKKASSVSLV